MIDLAVIADGLVRTGAGLWETRDSSEGVLSYPSGDTDLCFGVEESSFWFAHRNEVISAAVARFPPRGAVFDIGGGNGFVAKALADRGYEVVLVEPSRDGTLHAVGRGLMNVVSGTLADARFHHGTFGAAGLFDVIEHVEDDVAFLRALRPLLMEDAPLYLTVPAGQWLWSVDDEAAGHFRRYRRRTIAAALGAAGFEVLYVTCFFGLLTLPVALFRALPTRFGLRRPVDEGSIGREHAANGGVGRKILARLLASETGIVTRGFSLPFGTSILVVARARRYEAGILTA
ncbi:MAG TPA: class I SAM-dependent methyltransferase [Thermoanaerobaculia bacterium]|nr:class I SAM-dependent methyltransferase [Thermoanaerobaculia bacterium]